MNKISKSFRDLPKEEAEKITSIFRAFAEGKAYAEI
jgi:hypothetical protein